METLHYQETASTHMSGHYQRLAKRYEKMFFYRPDGDYQRHVVAEVSKRMKLNKDQAVVDIGGGTGTFLHQLRNCVQGQIKNEWICVDPSIDMLRSSSQYQGVKQICMDAITFSNTAKNFDRVLMKEVIHHIEHDKLQDYLRNIRSALNPGGRLLVVSRPLAPMEHPLFAAAKKRWDETIGDPKDYVEAFQAAGFKCNMEIIRFPIVIEKEDWFNMIRQRFWSLFYHFNDEELEAGIKELDEMYPNQTTLSFHEHLAIISGDK